MFDADAEGARLVIAELVREYHAVVQRLLGPRLSARGLGDALRPLMHRQIGADAVAGAMRIIDAVGPQILPCENVELAAARPLGEARGRQRDMAFQHLDRKSTSLNSSH